MRDPLRHHHHHRSKQPSRAERTAMAVAKGVGTVPFLAVALTVIGLWFAVNGVVPFAEHTVTALTHGGQFDPSPWILLNLLFSFEAFFTGSLVIISARASAIKDQEREVADAKHREELASEQTKLLEANTALTKQIHDLTVEVHGMLAKPKPKPRRASTK
jgi:uncharacterized membrane protein